MRNVKSAKKLNKIQTIDFSKNSYRNWDYINSPYKSTTLINGKAKKKEICHKVNNQIILHPNTKRTLIPNYTPSIIFKRSKKEVNNIPIFYEEKKLFQSKKRVDPAKSDINYHNLNNSKGKLCSKFRDKKVSQITNILCNLKDIPINDDIKNTKEKILRKNRDINFMKKLKDDFFSNIACLPNSLNNQTSKRIKRGKTYNHFKTNKNNNDNENNIRYKNQESITTFDMLKPSSFFDLKYKYRKNLDSKI